MHDLLYSEVMVNSLIIFVAREIDRSEGTTGDSQGQLLEAEAEGQRNSEIPSKWPLSCQSYTNDGMPISCYYC